MSNFNNESIHRIYNEWHTFAKTRNVEKLIALYADNAIFESPLVPAILKQSSGILEGKKAIKLFLEEGTKRRPNDLVKWYRTDEYLTNGNLLIWEYPRQTNDGEQIDILEVMRIKDDLIIEHRIYWGWKGCLQISDTLAKLKENKNT